MPDKKQSTLVHSTASTVTDNPKLSPERDIPMSIKGDFTVALAGDVVMTRPISQLDDPAVKEAIAPFQQADFAIGNLEQAIANWHEFKGHHYGVFAFLVMADPVVSDDLANIGFSIMTRANNRLFDFGLEGNRETDDHLRRVGISPVGFGEHLTEAQAPVYKDLPKGRVAAISVTSSNNHGQDAIFAPAAKIGNSNGRPGANTIRVSRTINLPEDAWDKLYDFVTTYDYAFPGAFPVLPTVMVYDDKIKINNQWYKKSDTPGYSYDMHPDDFNDIIRNTKNAATFSNFTVVSIHSHQWSIDPEMPRGGMMGETPQPPDFLAKLAHAVIDNGADIFCVHGPFDFRAIEIYKGKPIFYGLGSFVRQAYMQEVMPWETYRRFEFGDIKGDAINPYTTDITDAELLFSRTARHPAHYFEGAVAQCHFEESKLTGISLMPVDLGFDGPVSDLGIPKRANPEQSERILQKIIKNSAAFGTTITINNNTGYVTVNS